MDRRQENQEIEALSRELLSRRRAPRGPLKIGVSIGQLMARQGYGQSESNDARQEAWRQACGPRLAAHSRAGAVRRGVLEVLAGNSMVLQELTFQQQELLRRLAELAPDERIRALRLRVAAL